jgi:hypothetical protein
MQSYKVTFIADYFVLTTTVDVDNLELVNPNSRSSLEDMVYEEQIIERKANDFLKDWCGFAPLEFVYSTEIEEVSYA